jgi:large subunit ribosomal protein L10
MVMKNSLTGRACDEVGLSDMKQYLTGMTAIAIGTTDPVAPAKVLKEYAEKVESFQILAGYLDGAVVDAETVNKLADIPSKEVLLAKLLGSIKSPLYNFAYALQAIIDKDGEAAPEAAPEAAAEEAAAEA